MNGKLRLEPGRSAWPWFSAQDHLPQPSALLGYLNNYIQYCTCLGIIRVGNEQCLYPCISKNIKSNTKQGNVNNEDTDIIEYFLHKNEMEGYKVTESYNPECFLLVISALCLQITYDSDYQTTFRILVWLFVLIENSCLIKEILQQVL